MKPQSEYRRTWCRFPVNSHVVKLGVVLFQLGGPDSLENIRPFLYNLFCDPDIIDFPGARIARQPLARLIASTRAKHVAHHYAKIGGSSPILENTMRQASALEAELRNNLDARVTVAMRYWHPFTEEAIHQMERHAPSDLVLLPLYPQYSKTTTGSSLNEWARCFHPTGWSPRVHVIERFYEDGAYLNARGRSRFLVDGGIRGPARCGFDLQRAQHSGVGGRRRRSLSAGDRAHRRTGLAARRMVRRGATFVIKARWERRSG